MTHPLKSVFALLLGVALLAFLAYAVFNSAMRSRGEVVADRLGDEVKILTTERDFRDKVTELRMQRDRVQSGIKRLELRKAETLDHLREKGIRSSADITDDTDVTYALRNLKGWKTEIEKLQKDVASYNEAIRSIEVMLDELERQRINETVALSEEKYIELRKIVKDLNERLGVDKNNVLEDEELSQLLDEELAKDASSSEDKQ